MFRNAIVRPPSANFADGQTSVALGAPDYERALLQHDQYCAALESSGLSLTKLEPDPRYPDSTFVEDTAVLTNQWFILARPGTASRVGEVDEIGRVLVRFSPDLRSLQPPATLDGGDVCEAGNHFFIGVSRRTNEVGARQLAQLLLTLGYSSSLVDIRGCNDLLHLKSGLAYLGNNRLVVIEALANRAEFSSYELVRVTTGEEYAANCLKVNEIILLAAGYPLLEGNLRALGYKTMTLDMTEFQKMDGGLSCLSLRF